MTFIQKVQEARRLIALSIKKYPKIVVGCSFGKDSMVTLDLVRGIDQNVPVFSVLAETEFPETFKFAGEVSKQIQNYKEYIFSQDGNKCCGAPKVEMTKVALSPYQAWISGVRSTEGITRADFQPVEERNGLVKINPILNFTELDIWRYIALAKLPVNPKYNEGYRSLGCALCSFPEEDENETERAGRWKGTENAQGECGIHVPGALR